jgi:hypothetical protein
MYKHITMNALTIGLSNGTYHSRKNLIWPDGLYKGIAEISGRVSKFIAYVSKNCDKLGDAW